MKIVTAFGGQSQGEVRNCLGMAMMDNQEYSFLLWVKEIEMRYIELPKDQRIRVERWLDKLVGIDTNYEFVKERNMYAKLLLDMVFAKKLSFPFHTAPPEGSLPRFPNHLRLSLKSMVGAHETHFWRELYKRVVTADNPSLEEIYEINVARTADLEAEVYELKSKNEIQEFKIQELLNSNINLERTKAELSADLVSCKSQMEELQARLSMEEESVQSLGAELRECKEHVGQLADKVDSETAMNQTLSLHIDEDQQQLEEITELLAGEVAENKLLQSSLKEAEVVESALRKELTDRVAEVAELQSVVAERNGRVEALGQVISSQKEASNVLQTLLEGCRQHEQELGGRVVEMEQANVSLINELTELKNRHERCESDARRDRTLHEERVTTLERKIFEDEYALKECEETLAACQRELESRQSLLDHSNQRLQKCQQELDEARHNTDTCRMELEKCRHDMGSEIISLTTSLALARGDLARSKSELEQRQIELKEEVAALEQSALEKREEFDSIRQDLKETIRDLKQDLKDKESRLESALRREEEKVATLEERLTETINCSADIHKDFNNKIANYENTITERENEIDKVLEHAADIAKMLYESEHLRSILMTELDDAKVELESKARELIEAQQAVRQEEDKRELLNTQIQLLQQDGDRNSYQKSADVISRFKLERSLSQNSDRIAELEKELKHQQRVNDDLRLKLVSSESNTIALTTRLSEISRVASQRSQTVDELETKLLRCETARTESLNSCLKLAKENQMIERRYEDLYYAYKDTEAYKDTLRNSLMVLEDARTKSAHNLEEMIQTAFLDMIGNGENSYQRGVK